MSQGFIKMMRTDRTMALLKDQGLFTLLAAIALRADRETGIAKLGDWREIGFKSEPAYRRAKRRAERQGYATCKATNKGTLASLVSTDVYDINTPYPTNKATSKATNKATNKATTNKKIKNIKNTKNINTNTPPPGVDLDLWLEYLATRKRKGASPGKQAMTTLTNKILKLTAEGHDPNDLVAEANERGWKSVFAPQEKKSEQRTATDIARDSSWADGMEAPSRPSRRTVRNTPVSVSELLPR